MIKAQGNFHKRNMQRFKVKQCVDAREFNPFGILKKTRVHLVRRFELDVAGER